jgi:hypothetical protein
MASLAPNHPHLDAWPTAHPDWGHDRGLNGESLEAVMQAGPIAVCRLLDIAVLVAEELSTRHAAGSVHGQLTAGAIMLDRNGGIKILFQDAFPKGSPQDDQLALGQILLSAVLAMPGNPDSFRLVIDRLLSADPQDRYSSTRDLYLDLRSIRARLPNTPELASISPGAESRRPMRDRRPFLVIPLTLLSFSLFVFYLLNHSAMPKRGQAEIRSFPVWSADGRQILFVKPVGNVDQIFLDAYHSGEPVQLTHASRPSVNPRWSADGKSVEFQRSGKWQSLRLP